MKDNKELIIKYIILGIGIGMVFTNVLYYFNPKVEYEELPDKEVIKKAQELGMVTIKESIAINEEKEKELEAIKKREIEAEKLKDKLDEKKKIEDKEDKEDEEDEEDYKIITVDKGDSLYDVSDKLYKLGLIDDEISFNKMVYKKDLAKKIHYGDYEIEMGSDYNTIIDLLTR